MKRLIWEVYEAPDCAKNTDPVKWVNVTKNEYSTKTKQKSSTPTFPPTRPSLPPPTYFTMPCFLINFCGVWNPLGAISHFSKHPGSFWGSGERRRWAAGEEGLKFPFLLKADGGDFSRESRAAESQSVQSDSKVAEKAIRVLITGEDLWNEVIMYSLIPYYFGFSCWKIL